MNNFDHIAKLSRELAPFFPEPVDLHKLIEKPSGQDEFLDMVFCEAFKNHLSEASRDRINIYFKQYDVSQIDLFNLLATKLPHAYLATHMANSLITEAVVIDKQVIVDIGIGTGRQMSLLLKQLAESKKNLSCITIIGIEPDGESLKQAELTIQEQAKTLPFNVLFKGIIGVAEDLSADDWQSFGEKAIFNASFAMHHAKENLISRTDLLKNMARRKAQLVVLSEPNVHHYEEDYLQRFRNCYQHFYAVFKAIDSIDISANEKAALKRNFFGREIADILSTGERNERHEATYSWLQRLAEAGLHPYKTELNFEDPIVSVQKKTGYYSLDFKQMPIVSVLCFRS